MPLTCRNCGFMNPDEAFYCGKCGNSLSSSPNQPKTPQYPQNPTPYQPVQSFPSQSPSAVRAIFVLGFNVDWSPKSLALLDDRIIIWNFNSQEFSKIQRVGTIAGFATRIAVDVLLGSVAGGAIGRAVSRKMKEKKVKEMLRQAMQEGPLNLVITNPAEIAEVPVPGVTDPGVAYSVAQLNKVKKITVRGRMNGEFVETDLVISLRPFSTWMYKFLTVPQETVTQLLYSTQFRPLVQLG